MPGPIISKPQDLKRLRPPTLNGTVLPRCPPAEKMYEATGGSAWAHGAVRRRMAVSVKWRDMNGSWCSVTPLPVSRPLAGMSHGYDLQPLPSLPIDQNEPETTE